MAQRSCLLLALGLTAIPRCTGFDPKTLTIVIIVIRLFATLCLPLCLVVCSRGRRVAAVVVGHQTSGGVHLFEVEKEKEQLCL